MPTRKQIFCFTYAGGNASFYDGIEKDLPDFELIKIEYSGHGSRHSEPVYRSFRELADDMYSIILNRYEGRDYALFGYSMGAISAVEVLQRVILQKGMPEPTDVFLAAHEPQTKTELIGFRQEELDDWVKERTIRFGGIPEKIVNNKSFWRMYLPLYRADYSLISQYRFEDLNLVCGIPTTVFYSETDTKLADMRHWEKYFTGEIEFCRYDGTHFFIQDHHTEMAEVIRRKMNRRKTDDI